MRSALGLPRGEIGSTIYLYEDSLKTVLSVTPSVNVGSLEHYMQACRTSGPQGEHKTYCMYKA